MAVNQDLYALLLERKYTNAEELEQVAQAQRLVGEGADLNHIGDDLGTTSVALAMASLQNYRKDLYAEKIAVTDAWAGFIRDNAQTVNVENIHEGMNTLRNTVDEARAWFGVQGNDHPYSAEQVVIISSVIADLEAARAGKEGDAAVQLEQMNLTVEQIQNPHQRPDRYGDDGDALLQQALRLSLQEAEHRAGEDDDLARALQLSMRDLRGDQAGFRDDVPRQQEEAYQEVGLAEFLDNPMAFITVAFITGGQPRDKIVRQTWSEFTFHYGRAFDSFDCQNEVEALAHVQEIMGKTYQADSYS